MAKKGQKFQRYTEDFKQEILEQFRSGIPATVLAQKYNVPRGTILTWDYQSHHSSASHKRGRPKGDIDYKERYGILKKFQAFLKAPHATK